MMAVSWGSSCGWWACPMVFVFFVFCFFSCWLLLVVAVLSLCSSLLARYFIFFDQLHRIITVLKVHYRANRQTDRKRRTDTENMQRWCLRAGLIIGSTPPVVTDERTSGSRPLTNASVIITIVLCWKNSCESIHPPTDPQPIHSPSTAHPQLAHSKLGVRLT